MLIFYLIFENDIITKKILAIFLPHKFLKFLNNFLSAINTKNLFQYVQVFYTLDIQIKLNHIHI